MTIDAFLNVAMPIAIIVIVCAGTYAKFSEPINKLIDKIRELFNKGKEKGGSFGDTELMFVPRGGSP